MESLGICKSPKSRNALSVGLQRMKGHEGGLIASVVCNSDRARPGTGGASIAAKSSFKGT